MPNILGKVRKKIVKFIKVKRGYVSTDTISLLARERMRKKKAS